MSEDGQSWTRRGELEGRLTAVTVDPGDERVVWVATPTSVMMERQLLHTIWHLARRLISK